MLGLNEMIDQLAVAMIVHWYDHFLMKEDGHIYGRVLDLGSNVEKVGKMRQA